MYKIMFGLLLAALIFSCKKEKANLTQVQTSEVSFVNSSGDPITSLNQLENSNAGSLTSVPEEQVLLENWDYQNVYHFENNSGETHEIYTFEDESALELAQGDCDKNYYKDSETKQMCCDGEGKGCSVYISTTGGVEVTTCPVN